MNNLNLNKITGCASSDERIYICDSKGRGLYFMNNPNKKIITFNLIAGNWKTENKIEYLKEPLQYIVPQLQQRTVYRALKPMKYRVGENEHKCTVAFKNDYADVFLDKEINETDIPHLVFVLFHENGHFFYGGEKHGTKAYFDNEHYCDCYAAKKMLERGFNPSQCLFAVEMCLSEEDSSRDRKDRMFDFLKRVKIK